MLAKRNHWFVFFLMVLGLSSCIKETVIDFPSTGEEYFPLKQGAVWYYEVDSVIWIGDAQTLYSTDSSKWMMKVCIDSTYYDNLGREAYIMKTSFRKDSTEPWATKNALYAMKTGSELLKQEVVWVNEINEWVDYTVLITKMIYPASKGKTWNANGYNNLGYQKYRYVKVNEPELMHDSVIRVEQQYISNEIEEKVTYETYAKNIGMVYRYEINSRKNSSDIYTSGYQLKIRLLSYTD